MCMLLWVQGLKTTSWPATLHSSPHMPLPHPGKTVQSNSTHVLNFPVAFRLGYENGKLGSFWSLLDWGKPSMPPVNCGKIMVEPHLKDSSLVNSWDTPSHNGRRNVLNDTASKRISVVGKTNDPDLGLGLEKCDDKQLKIDVHSVTWEMYIYKNVKDSSHNAADNVQPSVPSWVARTVQPSWLLVIFFAESN